MGKRQLLFVTYGDENIDEGVSYAIELAKAMFEDITLLLVQKKGNLMDKLGNLMTAVSFAEADEHETARQIMAGGSEDSRRRFDALLAGLVEKCRKEGIAVSVQNTDLDAVAGIRSVPEDPFRDRQGGVEPRGDRGGERYDQGLEPAGANCVPADRDHDPAGVHGRCILLIDIRRIRLV